MDKIKELGERLNTIIDNGGFSDRYWRGYRNGLAHMVQFIRIGYLTISPENKQDFIDGLEQEIFDIEAKFNSEK